MYGMSNTSPKLTFMAEGETVKERNMVLAYIMALHNEAKKQEKDDLPMDVSENPFYIKDASYEMNKPDEVDFNDERVKEFIKFIGWFIYSALFKTVLLCSSRAEIIV